MNESRWDRRTRLLREAAEIAGRKRLERSGERVPIEILKKIDDKRQYRISFRDDHANGST